MKYFTSVDTFNVTENIILGKQPTRGGKVNIKEAAKEIKRLSNLYGLDVDPYAMVEDISVGIQQAG